MTDDSLLMPTDHIYMWIEQGTSVMLKAVSSHRDPVELNEQELEEVISALQLSLKRLKVSGVG